MKILIVDDEVEILEMLQGMLGNDVSEITKAGSVAEAVSILEQNDNFSLVITDIVMPGQDGTELIKYVKAERPDLSVIAITGGVLNAQDDYVVYAEMYADKVLAKPFDEQELVVAMHEVLNKDAAA